MEQRGNSKHLSLVIHLSNFSGLTFSPTSPWDSKEGGRYAFGIHMYVTCTLTKKKYGDKL